MRFVTLFLAMLYLGGCANQYSISEQQIAHYLNDKIAKEYQMQQGTAALTLGLQNVSVKLGHQPGIMAVTAQARAKLLTPIMPLSATLQAEFTAKPVYDASSHGVFLKDLQLVQLSSRPAQLQRLLSGITPQLLQMTRTLLESQPVYVLDNRDNTQAKLAQITREIKVEKGRLLLLFQ
ncbi:DUF1439 domain-containing protein [Shewanella sp. YIC-542]|uniref:DUF1439 domain-containing protein n=1 Tax=Shewanella mytili TaxID=3377111 RepID=UPI00398E8170